MQRWLFQVLTRPCESRVSDSGDQYHRRMVLRRRKEALGGEDAQKTKRVQSEHPLSQNAAKTVFGPSTPSQCNLCLTLLVINKARPCSRGGHAEEGAASTRLHDFKTRDSQLISHNARTSEADGSLGHRSRLSRELHLIAYSSRPPTVNVDTKKDPAPTSC